MTKFKIVLTIWVGLTLCISSAVAELNKYDAEALEKTKNLLRSESQRNAAIEKSSEAQKYTQKMDQMGMNQNQKNQTFEISPDIFDKMVKEQNGDAEAVKRLLMKAQQNPEEFYKSLPPESRNQIRSLSSEIESIMTGKPPF